MPSTGWSHRWPDVSVDAGSGRGQLPRTNGLDEHISSSRPPILFLSLPEARFSMQQVGRTRAGRLGDAPPAASTPTAPAGGSPGAAGAAASPRQFIARTVQGSPAAVFSKTICPSSRKAKEVWPPPSLAGWLAGCERGRQHSRHFMHSGTCKQAPSEGLPASLGRRSMRACTRRSCPTTCQGSLLWWS